MTPAFTLFDVQPEERVRFVHAALGLGLLASAALTARAAGTALFLERFGDQQYPYLYLGTAVLVILTSLVLVRALARWSVLRVLSAVAVVVALACILIRLGLAAGLGVAAVAAYYLADVLAQVSVTLFWALQSIVLNPRESRRLLPLIGAGGTTACLIAGLLVGPLGRAFSTEDLLVVVFLLVCAYLWVTWSHFRREPGRLGQAESASRFARRRPAPSAGLFSEPLVRGVAALVAVTTVALVMTDFVFISSLRAQLEGAALAGFIGNFYALASGVAIFVQLQLGRQVLRRGGVFAALAILPLALLAGSVGGALTGGFWWAVVAKLVEPVFLFTVNASAVQVLYHGMPRPIRPRVRTIHDGVVRPLALLLTALLLLLGLRTADVRVVALLVAGCCIPWLLIARTCARQYLSGLVRGLGQERIDLSGVTLETPDRAAVTWLRGRLGDARDHALVLALQVAREWRHVDLREEHRRLLASTEDPSVRTACLDYLAVQGRQEDSGAAEGALSDPCPGVRMSAVIALASLRGPDAPELLARALDDADPGVRAEAAAELALRGDEAARRRGTELLRAGLDGADSELRRATAWALRRADLPERAELLRRALEDEQLPVLRAALESAEQAPEPAALPLIRKLLSRGDAAPAAEKALARAGELALPLLVGADEDEELGEGAARVPRVLEGIGGPEALAALRERLRSSSPRVALAAAEALARVRPPARAGGGEAAEERALALVKLERAKRLQEQGRRAAATAGGEFLALALRDEAALELRAAITLLLAAVREAPPGLVLRHLIAGDRDEKAAAIEVLHAELGGTLRSEMMQLLESPETGGESLAGHELTALVESGSPMVQAGALAALTSAGPAAIELAAGLLASEETLLRETALHALARLAPARAREAASGLLQDPSPRVCELAQGIAGPAGGGGS